MKWQITAIAMAVGLAACEQQQRGTETGQAGEGMATDTIVTEREVRDTALVTTDTSVEVDTAMERGETGVGQSDTIKDTRPPGAGRGTDEPLIGDTMQMEPDTATVP